LTNGNTTRMRLISNSGPKLEIPNQKTCNYSDERFTDKSIFSYTGPKDILFVIEDSSYISQLA
jgi:hypothetical protein